MSSNRTSRFLFIGGLAAAFTGGLVFAAGFDLTRFGYAQSQATVQTAGFTPGTPPASMVELNSSFVTISETVTPSVVSISAQRTVAQQRSNQRPNSRQRRVPPGLEDFFQQFQQEQQVPQASSGSGFIISGDGYIL